MELAERIESESIDSLQLIKKYALRLIRRWPYILAFFLFSLLIGYLINRYETPVFKLKARITTKKFSKTNTGMVPGLVDASFFLNGMTEVYEEIPNLTAPKRMEDAVSKLDFHVSYFSEGFIKTIESKRGVGFDVTIYSMADSEGGHPSGVPIYVNHIDARSYRLVIEDDFWNDQVKDKQYAFGAVVTLGNATFSIANTNGSIAEPNKFYFVFNKKSDVARDYRNRLVVEWSMKGSAMLDLSMESELPDKEIDFLRAYYEVVEEWGIQEKNETLDNTIGFIDEQMKLVTDSILYYQALMDGMKIRNFKLNLGTDYIFSKFEELDKKKAEFILNERYLDYLTDYFDHNRTEGVFAPSVMELKIPLLETWVMKYIEERLSEKLYKTGDNARNPLINRQDSLRRKLVNGIYESVRSTRERNKESVSALDKEAELLYGSIKNVQVDFRELSRYERLYQLNLTLFDLFLRRKTEAAISKASATSDYKVIEAPYYSRMPFKPDKQLTLTIAAAIGLLLPIFFSLLIDFTNPTITDRDDLKAQTSMPLLGYVPHSQYDSVSTIADHPKSVIAESFRAIRANLKYLLPDAQAGGKIILITSGVSGEGKTFCSINLAQVLLMSGKKTLLIGADLRKPGLKNYLAISQKNGLSEYLAGMVSVEDILIKGSVQLLDFINAGHIPPNPAELLAGDRMRVLIAQLKTEYDYIIIDTPPIGIVSDTMELFKYADYNILMVRQKITHKAALAMVNELYEEGKLSKFGIIFNDIDIKRNKTFYGGYAYGMGYGGYGYGYYDEDKKKRKNNI